jgi:hypothetical protein
MRVLSMVLAIYFGLLSLAPQWQGLEFFKFDALISHYEAYQKECNEPSLWSFVQEHYLQQVNEKQHDHRQLPFKSVQTNTLVTLFMPTSGAQVLVQSSEISFTKDLIFSAPESISNNDFFECWHPPQLV